MEFWNKLDKLDKKIKIGIIIASFLVILAIILGVTLSPSNTEGFTTNTEVKPAGQPAMRMQALRTDLPKQIFMQTDPNGNISTFDFNTDTLNSNLNINGNFSGDNISGINVTATGNVNATGNVTASGNMSTQGKINKIGQIFINNGAWSDLESVKSNGTWADNRGYPVDHDTINYPSAIVNDTRGDKALMLVGNKSGGDKTRRTIKMYDDLFVTNGSITANNITAGNFRGGYNTLDSSDTGYLRINATKNSATIAAFNGLNVNDGGGLGIGTWEKVVPGNLRIGNTTINEDDLKVLKQLRTGFSLQGHAGFLWNRGGKFNEGDEARDITIWDNSNGRNGHGGSHSMWKIV